MKVFLFFLLIFTHVLCDAPHVLVPYLRTQELEQHVVSTDGSNQRIYDDTTFGKGYQIIGIYVDNEPVQGKCEWHQYGRYPIPHQFNYTVHDCKTMKIKSSQVFTVPDHELFGVFFSDGFAYGIFQNYSWIHSEEDFFKKHPINNDFKPKEDMSTSTRIAIIRPETQELQDVWSYNSPDCLIFQDGYYYRYDDRVVIKAVDGSTNTHLWYMDLTSRNILSKFNVSYQDEGFVERGWIVKDGTLLYHQTKNDCSKIMQIDLSSGKKTEIFGCRELYARTTYLPGLDFVYGVNYFNIDVLDVHDKKVISSHKMKGFECDEPFPPVHTVCDILDVKVLPM